ncbi:MAG: hypothetical protein ABW133_06575 [Polyangiaceae bacterium]
MKWKTVIGASLSACGMSLVSPAFAQDAPPGSTAPAQTPAPTDPSTTPPSSDTPAPTPPSDGTETRPAPSEPPPPNPEPAPTSEPPPPVVMTGPDANSGAPSVDQLPRKIGDKLAPLVVTAGFGYSSASIKYPGFLSDNISGPFVELTGGMELDPRLRLSFGISSLSTTIRRNGENWEEGNYVARAAPAAGLRSQRGPTDPYVSPAGGVAVQRTLTAAAFGPRIDYFPLGSQGPYLGATTALATLWGVETLVGLDVGARIGADWRPFQELSFSIEGGAHHQMYNDARVTIPYGLVRLNLLLDPLELSSSGKPRTNLETIQVLSPQQRTLPTAPVR